MANPLTAQTLVIIKAGTLRRMFIVSSNPYEDREGEIVSEGALRRNVKDFVGNDLLFWHRGHPIGRIVKARMEGPFLIEEAVELPNRVIETRAFDGRGTQITTIKTVWDEIQSNPDVYNAASIGFRFTRTDRNNGVYKNIRKHETSILPNWAAANAYTYSEVQE